MPILPNGQGDITNPNAWQDVTGGYLPPHEYTNLNIQLNTGGPNNGDGRYWWRGNSTITTGGAIAFVGLPAYIHTGTAVLTWQIEQAATDGSAPKLQWSQDGGATYTTASIGSAGTPQAGINESGYQNITLTTATTGLALQVFNSGGTPSASAHPWVVAVAITRNANERLPWDYSNPFNPASYNATSMDFSSLIPSQTLAQLRTRILIGLGFSNQAANPPPGMAAFVNDKLLGAQNWLWRRYNSLHTRRFFRWKIVPGQRFYSLRDNDEDVLSNYHMDPNKTIEWAGIQDTRNVWYPLIQGIPPQLYTMIDKPWRPARYDIRQALEVYPAPDQTYWLWIRANFGLMSFTSDSDATTIDSELVYLHAMALSKRHYGQPDANDYELMANAYRGDLIAGTHQTAHYIPGTIAVPPAVRPTLIQFSDGQSG